jgi:hypothetical protein
MLALAAAALVVVATHPVRVHGTHFRPGEAVRVTVHAGAETGHARAVAGGRGAFSATVRHLDLPSCTPFTVTAVGASGDRATFTRLRVACLRD